MVTATTDAISSLAMIFASEVVILGGGMHQFIGKYMLPHVQQRLNAMLPVYGKKPHWLKHDMGHYREVMVLL